MSAVIQAVCKRGHDMAASRRSHPNGDTYCYTCKQLRTKEARKRHPEKFRQYGKNANLRRLYGIEPAEYAALLVKQEGKCAVCSCVSMTRSLHVDHDHKTGLVRGLLCHSCNTALGLLSEDVARMLRLADYAAK